MEISFSITFLFGAQTYLQQILNGLNSVIAILLYRLTPKNGEILFLNLQRASRCVLVTDFDEITHAGIDHSNEAVVFVAVGLL